MQFLALLGLAATASAIDARLYNNQGCSGGYVQCGGLNPDTCCFAAGSNYGSVGFNFIPLDWTIDTRGHSGGRCNNVQQRGYPTRVADICHSIGPFSGAGYSFRNKKRGDADSADCVKADTLGFDDGSLFNIADLDDETAAELLAIAAQATNGTDIPEEFQKLRIE